MKTICNNFLDSLTSKGFFYGLFLHLVNIPTLIAKAPVIPQVVGCFFSWSIKINSLVIILPKILKSEQSIVHLEHFTCLFAVG